MTGLPRRAFAPRALNFANIRYKARMEQVIHGIAPRPPCQSLITTQSSFDAGISLIAASDAV